MTQARSRSVRRVAAALAVACAGLAMAMAGADSGWWDAAWTKRRAVVLPTRVQGLLRVDWPSGVKPEEVRCAAAGTGAGASEPLEHWAQWLELTDVRRVARRPEAHEGFPRVVRTRDGRLLLFYRVGTAHAASDSSIVLRTSRDDGAHWSDERTIWKPPGGTSAHNPVPLVEPGGRVILWMSRFVFSERGHERQPCVWCWSDDQGETWTEPVRFDPSADRSCYYVTDAIATSAGLLACDAAFPPSAAGPCFAQIWHSGDAGRTWTVRSRLTRPDENLGDETALLETEPGTILCLLRNRRGRGTFRLWSRDGGKTWSDREELGPMIGVLQRPLLTRLDAATVLLTGRDRERRLVVAYVSRDNGRTFGQRQVLDSFQADGAYTAACPTGPRSVFLAWYTDQGTTPGKPDIKAARLRILDQPKSLWIRLPRELPPGPSLFVYFGNPAAPDGESRAWAWTGPADPVAAKLQPNP